MQYTIKAGIFYNKWKKPLVKIKNELMGPARKIQSVSGELLLKVDIHYFDESRASSGDVRNREYVLVDKTDQVIGLAYPGYAEGEEPDVVGWPICRMPKVDHADITVNGEKYFLTMQSSQKYSLMNSSHTEVFFIMHKGIVGGWIVEDYCGFSPEIICGIFIFCRYIEQENEFSIV